MYGVSGGAPEIDGSLAPKVGFLLGCLFLIFGHKKQDSEKMSGRAAIDQLITMPSKQSIIGDDHSRAAAITFTTYTAEQPTVSVPPAALKLIGQLLGAMREGRPIVLMPPRRTLCARYSSKSDRSVVS